MRKKMRRTLLCTLLVLSAAFCLASFNPAYSDYQFYNLHDLAADASYLDGQHHSCGG